MLKSIIVPLVVLGLLSGTHANAQNFSFDAKRNEITPLGGIGPEGALYTGASYSGTYTAKFDGEKPTKGTYKCVVTSQPPGLFQSHTACTMKQSDGSFTSAWGCNALNAEGTEMTCVGGLFGRSGRFEGLRGGAANHVKGADSEGVGHFYAIGQ